MLRSYKSFISTASTSQPQYTEQVYMHRAGRAHHAGGGEERPRGRGCLPRNHPTSTAGAAAKQVAITPTTMPATRVVPPPVGPPGPAAHTSSPTLSTATAGSQLIFSLDVAEFMVQDTVDTQLDVSKDVELLQAACDVQGTRAEKVLAHVEALRPLCTHGSSVDVWQLGVLLRSRYGYLVRHRTANGAPRSASYLRKLRHSYLVCKMTEDGPTGMDIVVDLNFKDHFALPHSRPWYDALLAAVPRDWVGSAEGAAGVARLLAAGMRLVFLQLGQPLPPWRERRALLSKWLPEVVSDEPIPLQPLPDQNAGIAAMLAPYQRSLASNQAAAAATSQSQEAPGPPHQGSTGHNSSSSGGGWGTHPEKPAPTHRPSAADLHRHNWIPTRSAAPVGGARGAAGAEAEPGRHDSSHQGSSRHAAFQPQRRVVGFPEAGQLQAVMAAAVAAAAQHPHMQAEPRMEERQQQLEGGEEAAAAATAAVPQQLRLLNRNKVQNKGCSRTQQQQQAPVVLMSDLGLDTDASSKSPDVVATITLSSAPKAGVALDPWLAVAGACSKAPAELEGSVRRGKPAGPPGAVNTAATAAAQWLASATAAACQQQQQQLQQLMRPTQEGGGSGAADSGGSSKAPVPLAQLHQVLDQLLPRVHTVKLVGVR